MIPDPSVAPRRADLGFLTTRSRPRTKPGPHVDYVRRPAPAAPRPPTPTPTATPQPSPTAGAPRIDYVRRPPTRPPANNPLDLSGPAPTPAAPPAGNNPLDLSAPRSAQPAPAPSPPPQPPVDNLLDLSRPPSPTGRPNPPSALRTAPNPVVAQPPSIHPVRRLDADDREILAPTRPTLALTRVQSGVGRLAVELFAPPAPAVALACILTDADGESTVVDPTHPRSPPPPTTTDPLITFSGNGFGSFGINLRRSRELSRLIVVATAVVEPQIDWTGTLSLTTFGGGRIDIPLDATPASTTTIVASIYNVDGEYVLRAEGQPMNGSLREAARSFGFDTISWLDPRTPIG